MRISTALFCFVSILSSFFAMSVKNIHAQITEETCPVITKNLGLASKNSDVVLLQKFLISKGYKISAITERGATYGFFGNETKDAVVEYQKSVNLPSYGFVGPLTITKIKSSCGGSVVAEVPKEEVVKKVVPEPVVKAPSPTPTPTPAPATVVSPNNDEVKISDAKISSILVGSDKTTSNKATFASEFTLINSSQRDIYIGNKADNSIVAKLIKGKAKISMTLMTADPTVLKGDTSSVYIIPKGQARVFIANGRIDNSLGVTGIQTIQISEIPYSIDQSLSSPIMIPTVDIKGFKIDISLVGGVVSK